MHPCHSLFRKRPDGISASQSGTGNISRTAGALNGTTQAVSVSLTGDTVGNVSGNAVQTADATGFTTIAAGAGVTSTAANAINATADPGNIAFSTVQAAWSL